MVNRDAPHIRAGRVGGRVRNRSPRGEAPQGRPGRPRREEQARALVDLFAGTACTEEIAARVKVRPRTVERWRDEAVPLVANALMAGGERTCLAPHASSGQAVSSSTVSSSAGRVARRTVRAEKMNAIRTFLLEEFVRVHPPDVEQVARLSRETPHGRATVATVCALFGVRRTLYYEARARAAARGAREAARDDGCGDP